jgi:hypothetical protein
MVKALECLWKLSLRTPVDLLRGVVLDLKCVFFVDLY